MNKLILLNNSNFSQLNPTTPMPPIANGGIRSHATSRAMRDRLDLNFIPNVGPFQFPVYDTTGIRITKDSHTVIPNSYGYWRNINNHINQDSLLIFVNTVKGVKIFEVDKNSLQVTNGATLDIPIGEWYWSALHPFKIYYRSGSQLLTVDVKTGHKETIVDIKNQFGANKYVFQAHSSNDDKAHSFSISDDNGRIGAAVFKNGEFSYYPGVLDECQIDKSGTWLLIKSVTEDNRIINIDTGFERVLRNNDGAAGHSDNGFGYMVGEDDFAVLPHSIFKWDFRTSSKQLVYHLVEWGSGPGHISHCNAPKPFAISSISSRYNYPRANEIVAYPLNGNLECLVVAPSMVDMDTGVGTDYDKMPKGNIDITGEYFFWTANRYGNRTDAFIVKIPQVF